MSCSPPLILWFRQDLRIADHPALMAALAKGQPVLPLYIFDKTSSCRPMGSASRWWLHHALAALRERIPLILRQGQAENILTELIGETGADTVIWSQCYDPGQIARDSQIKAHLLERGVRVESYNSALLFEPWTIKTKSGGPYQVFTPFWRSCLAQADDIPPPLPEPELKQQAFIQAAGLSLDELELTPHHPNWAAEFSAHWKPGERAARDQLLAFIDEQASHYREQRNRPDLAGTSRLSPHLHFGEISPRQIWLATQTALSAGRINPPAEGEHFLSEIGWREFSHHLLFHFPDMQRSPLNRRFKDFQWRENGALLGKWQKGQTGYPIVDAGMRELWRTGWMHNRVRMIVGSFLVKDLLLSWQEGEDWFWDTLLDADLANNTASWQWIAGCGADAAPYFRVFNPVLQGEKFDPEGAYVRKYVPEIAALPDKWIHRPFEAPQDVLQAGGITLGQHYPRPLVEHRLAREQALAAYAALKEI